jgi:hypothetical protein
VIDTSLSLTSDFAGSPESSMEKVSQKYAGDYR